MNTIAIYPGTFDPITNGHIDIIQRASKLFNQVIIAIAESPHKNPLFNLKDRINLVKVSLFENSSNIKIYGFNELLIDFAKSHQANIIIRGLRTTSDFEYELQLASMNNHLNNNIETLFLPTTTKYCHISSSLVREIARLNGDIKDFVPEIVLNKLNHINK
jgi:pantetheine-phosphate adenylyltransferase